MERNAENDTLRFILGEKFRHESTIQPTANSWENVAAHLDKMRGEKKKRRVIYFWSFAASVLLLIGLTTAFLVNQEQTEFTDEDVTPIDNQEEFVMPDSPGKQEEMNGMVEYVGPDQMHSSSDQLSEMNLDGETIFRKKPELSFDELNVTHVDVEGQSSVLISESSDLKLLAPTEVSKAHMMDPLLVPLVDLDPVLTPKSKWDLSFSFGAGRRNRSFAQHKSYQKDDHFIAGKKHLMQQYKEVGLSTRYRFNDRFAIKSGIKLSSWSYRSDIYQKEIGEKNDFYEFESAIGRITPHANELKPFYQNVASDTLLFDVSMNQNLSYLSIPLQFQLRHPGKKIQPYLELGVSGNFLLDQKTDMRFENSGLNRDISIDQLDGLKKFHLSGNLGLGIECKLGKRLSVYSELQSDLPLSKFYQSNDQSAQTLISRGLGLNAGIFWSL